MRKLKSIKIFLVIILLLSLLSGCFTGRSTEAEQPIEPITPQGSPVAGFLGHYISSTSRGGISSLALTSAGNKALIAPKDNKAYLLDKEGHLLWEKTMGGEVFKTAITPTGEVFSIATREGEVIFLGSQNEVTGEVKLERQIIDFTLSDDGYMAAILSYSLVPEKERGLLHLINNEGEIIWERTVEINPERPTNLAIGRYGNGLAFIGEAEGEPYLAWFDLQGNHIWRKEGYTGVSLSAGARIVAAIKGRELTVFDRFGTKKWSYDDTEVNLTHVYTSGNGDSILAYSAYSTGQDNLFYFSSDGESSPWKRRVPAQSEISISGSGGIVSVASWRHYREEFTQVTIFDGMGQEINSLQVAGRGQQADLSREGNVLVLGSDDGSIFFLDVLGDGGEEPSRFSYGAPVYKPAEDTPDGEKYIRLFFYDQRAETLIPVSRRVPEGDLLARALDELSRGPRLGSGLLRTISGDVTKATDIYNGTAYISLPPALMEIGAAAQFEAAISSILYTVSQFPQVNYIQFLVDGEVDERLGEGELDISRPLPARKPGSSPGRQVIYSPVISENRYYLTMKEVALRGSGNSELAVNLLEELIDSNRAFFPADMSVSKVEFQGDKAEVDLSANIQSLYVLLSDPNRADLILEGITFTISENFGVDFVEILINGEKYSMPELPKLSREIRRPFYINPE